MVLPLIPNLKTIGSRDQLTELALAQIETDAGSAISPEMALTSEAARDFLDELTGEQ